MVQILGGHWTDSEYVDVRGTLTNFGRVILESDNNGPKNITLPRSTYTPERVTILTVKKTMYNILDQGEVNFEFTPLVIP